MSRFKAKRGIAVSFAITLVAAVTAWFFLGERRSALSQVSAQSNPTGSAPLPRFVTFNLAEVNLQDTDKNIAQNRYAGKYDVERNYSLVYGDGPDNWEHILTLRPGSAWPESREKLAKLFAGVKLNLVTGRGVAIGDTRQQVEKKLGRPTRQTATEYEYLHNGKRQYRASYRFENGRLRAIQFVYTKAAVENAATDGPINDSN